MFGQPTCNSPDPPAPRRAAAWPMAVALMLGCRGAAPAPAAACGAPAPALAQMETDVLAAVNRVRARGIRCGDRPLAPVPALARDAALDCAARAHSADMAGRG